MDEARRANQEADRRSHPPRGVEADQRRAGALRERRVKQAELPELELGKVFRRDGVADLVVRDPVEARDDHAEGDQQNEDAQLLENAHKSAGAVCAVRSDALPGVGAVKAGFEWGRGFQFFTGKRLGEFEAGFNFAVQTAFMAASVAKLGTAAVGASIERGVAGAVIPFETVGSPRTWGVVPRMQARDIASGVLTDSGYELNSTARNVMDTLTPTGRVGGGNNNGSVMYVIDDKGLIIIGTRNRKVRMPHPALIGGSDPRVRGAGRVEIRNGRIYSVNNHSGHFQPGAGSFEAAQEAFGELPSNSFHKDFLGFLPYEP